MSCVWLRDNHDYASLDNDRDEPLEQQIARTGKTQVQYIDVALEHVRESTRQREAAAYGCGLRRQSRFIPAGSGCDKERIGSDADDADLIVPARRDNTCDRRSVHIRNEAAAVLAGEVTPGDDSAAEFAMISVHASVDDADAHTASARPAMGLGHVERGVAVLEIRVWIVVLGAENPKLVHRLRRLDPRVAGEPLQKLRPRCVGGNFVHDAVHLQRANRPCIAPNETVVARKLLVDLSR